jgi:hypothetical protein
LVRIDPLPLEIDEIAQLKIPSLILLLLESDDTFGKGIEYTLCISLFSTISIQNIIHYNTDSTT